MLIQRKEKFGGNLTGVLNDPRSSFLWGGKKVCQVLPIFSRNLCGASSIFFFFLVLFGDGVLF